MARRSYLARIAQRSRPRSARLEPAFTPFQRGEGLAPIASVPPAVSPKAPRRVHEEWPDRIAPVRAQRVDPTIAAGGLGAAYVQGSALASPGAQASPEPVAAAAALPAPFIADASASVADADTASRVAGSDVPRAWGLESAASQRGEAERIGPAPGGPVLQPSPLPPSREGSRTAAFDPPAEHASPDGVRAPSPARAAAPEFAAAASALQSALSWVMTPSTPPADARVQRHALSPAVSEAVDPPIASMPAPLESRPKATAARERSLQIGSIDIELVPAPQAPPPAQGAPVARSVASSNALTPIARGFVTSLGLRQG